ncbi:relaxase/mobilization nuclease domain-containing protein [Pseudoflavitalea rhizosphaerae]|uniref:relaxase/mobilization nuclease domain-containing protein n=1 Tax=Pseudoflavitalea rhizosphaerae TaxID=1884793 RepID=UPI000F8E4EE6|nr:relaxase/mobilization nuclease domain-containing protein [Pseudoflavitalea rhizosphaerae]
MIGHVSTGASAFHCISYCLEDKQELSAEKKEQLSRQDDLQHMDRAEVLFYNKCFGNKYELASQFREVEKLSKRVEKPVLHMSLRLAPGEQLSKDQLMEIGRECAKEFGVADHQYICVLHKDTKEQHIHIAANRVGFDGKVASDSNNYKRMAALCRRLEKQYNLKEVLSPRAFLSPKERLLPRHDSRKEKLKTDIRQTLEKVHCFGEFERKMQELGYKVIKGRGISFIDKKKVKIKGSEVGFAWAKIEKILAIKQQLEMKVTEQKLYEKSVEQKIENSGVATVSQRLLQQTRQDALIDRSPLLPVIEGFCKVLDELLKPEYTSDSMPYEFTYEGYKRRKKKELIQSRKHSR